MRVSTLSRGGLVNEKPRVSAVARKSVRTIAQEIIPIEINGKQGTQWVEKDEGVRPDTTLEKLAALKPVFHKEGVFTAGNSSQISDGAATLLLASQKAVDGYGLQPIARILKGT